MWDWDVSWPGEKTKTTAALVGGCPAVTQAAWHDERNSWNWHHRPHHMHHHHHQTGYYTAKKIIKYYIIKLFKKKYISCPRLKKFLLKSNGKSPRLKKF